MGEARMSQSTYGEQRTILWTQSSLVTLYAQESNPGHQGRQDAPFPTESSCQPSNLFLRQSLSELGAHQIM